MCETALIHIRALTADVTTQRVNRANATLHLKVKIADFMVAKRIHIKPKHSVHCAGKIAKILDRPETTHLLGEQCPFLSVRQFYLPLKPNDKNFA